MRFPLSPDDEHEFYQFLHMHALGYDFPGGYKMRPITDTRVNVVSLWYVEDSIGCRLTDAGMWVGRPREEGKEINWERDTTHAFKDAYELLLRCGGSGLPALRRLRPDVARVP